MKKFLLHNKWKFVLIMSVKVFTTLLVIGSAFLLQLIVNSAVAKVEPSKFLNIVYIGLGYLVILGIFSFLNNNLTDKYIQRCHYELRNAYFTKLINSKYKDISDSDSGKYISALTNDTNTINEHYFKNMMHIIGDSVYVAGSFIAVFVINKFIALIMVGLTLVLAIIPAIMKKYLVRANLSRSKSYSEYTSKLKEYLIGIGIIKSYNAEDKFVTETNTSNKRLMRENYRVNYINNMMGVSAMILSQALTLSMVGVSGYLAIQGRVDFGAIIAVLTLTEKFYGPIQSLASRIFNMVSIKRVTEVLLAVINRDVKKRGKDNVHFKKAIELTDVSFRYKKDDRLILDKVSLTIERDKKYLVLGKSGSGKSTILKLISKIYDSYEGSITLDKTDYQDINDTAINKLVALAQQNCYLFSKTLKENIDLLESGDEKRLLLAIEQSGLTEFVDRLPQGVNTIIDEEVNPVSGGEKLRINLARALFRNGSILLLDEVTSAVDRLTANHIEKTILSIKDKTILNVCHKFNENSLPKYDSIIIIENGRIAAEGDYIELLGNPILAKYRDIAE